MEGRRFEDVLIVSESLELTSVISLPYTIFKILLDKKDHCIVQVINCR